MLESLSSREGQDCGVNPSNERKKSASWAWVRSQTDQVRVGVS